MQHINLNKAYSIYRQRRLCDVQAFRYRREGNSVYLMEGYNPSQIAKKLGRNRSIINREIKGGMKLKDKYFAQSSHQKAKTLFIMFKEICYTISKKFS